MQTLCASMLVRFCYKSETFPRFLGKHKANLLKQTSQEPWEKSLKCSRGLQKSNFSLDIANTADAACAHCSYVHNLCRWHKIPESCTHFWETQDSCALLPFEMRKQHFVVCDLHEDASRTWDSRNCDDSKQANMLRCVFSRRHFFSSNYIN